MLLCLDTMVVRLEFLLRGVNQEPGRGGINPAIGITNFLGRFTGNVVSNDANNNGRGVSSVQGVGNNILARGRDRGTRR